jgi:type IV/VI secretion system ImpK/VasF family protein
MKSFKYQYPDRVMRLCAEIINKVTEIPTLPSIIDLDGFHADICAKFDAIIKHCRRKSMPSGAAPELIYPLAALVDEALLSDPKYRCCWTERPLQLRYFGEVIAGTKFFAKLEDHIQADEPCVEILETYFISLALGLKGMYGGEEAKRCAKITERLGETLIDIRNKNKRAMDVIDRQEDRSRLWSVWTLAILAATATVSMILTAVIKGIATKNLVEFLGG